jgi:hypothetical protein
MNDPIIEGKYELITESELIKLLKLPAGDRGKRRLRRWLKTAPVRQWSLRHHRLFSARDVLAAMELPLSHRWPSTQQDQF